MAHSRPWVRPLVALAGFAISSALMVGPASATARTGVVELSYADNLFCGQVEFHYEGSFEGRYTEVTHGPDGYPLYKEMSKTTETDTNLVTGITVTSHWVTREGDERAFNNVDGTRSLIRSRSGTVVITDSNGKVVDRASGHLSFELVFDTHGTPTNYDDDTFLSFRLIRDNTNTLDFCPRLLAATGS